MVVVVAGCTPDEMRQPRFGLDFSDQPQIRDPDGRDQVLPPRVGGADVGADVDKEALSGRVSDEGGAGQRARVTDGLAAARMIFLLYLP